MAQGEGCEVWEACEGSMDRGGGARKKTNSEILKTVLCQTAYLCPAAPECGLFHSPSCDHSIHPLLLRICLSNSIPLPLVSGQFPIPYCFPEPYTGLSLPFFNQTLLSRPPISCREDLTPVPPTLPSRVMRLLVASQYSFCTLFLVTEPWTVSFLEKSLCFSLKKHIFQHPLLLHVAMSLVLANVKRNVM